MAEALLDDIDHEALEAIRQYVRDCSESSDIDKRTTVKHALLQKIFGMGAKQVGFFITSMTTSNGNFMKHSFSLYVRLFVELLCYFEASFPVSPPLKTHWS